MLIYIIILICSFYVLTQFAATLTDLVPLVVLSDNMVLTTVRLVATKWSLPLGVIGLIYAILGLLLKSKDDDKNEKLNFVFLIFYLTYACIMVL